MSWLTLAVDGRLFFFCKFIFGMTVEISWLAVSSLENWRLRDRMVRIQHDKSCPFRNMGIGVHFLHGFQRAWFQKNMLPLHFHKCPVFIAREQCQGEGRGCGQAMGSRVAFLFVQSEQLGFFIFVSFVIWAAGLVFDFPLPFSFCFLDIPIVALFRVFNLICILLSYLHLIVNC